MSVVTSMPMSSPMISRMFGRGDLPSPGFPCSFAANTDVAPTISAASTANPRNVIMTALLITVSSPRFVVTFNNEYITAIPNLRPKRKILAPGATEPAALARCQNLDIRASRYRCARRAPWSAQACLRLQAYLSNPLSLRSGTKAAALQGAPRAQLISKVPQSCSPRNPSLRGKAGRSPAHAGKGFGPPLFSPV